MNYDYNSKNSYKLRIKSINCGNVERKKGGNRKEGKNKNIVISHLHHV